MEKQGGGPIVPMFVAMAGSIGVLTLWAQVVEPLLMTALCPPLTRDQAHAVALFTGVMLSVAVYTAINRYFSGRPLSG